jgi:hypothetical protein
LYYCHSREGGNPENWENSTFYEIVNNDVAPLRNLISIIFKNPGTVLSSAILLGFADSKKNGWHVGWVEERNTTKDIGMLNPTYD